MSAQPDQNHNLRQVVLPSGRTIQVVYFGEGVTSAARSQAPASGVSLALHVCEACDSELVYPIDWDEVGTTHWRVTLRCPNCEWSGTDIFDQDTVERFDCELDRGTEALMRDLQRLTRANMEEDVERFVAALRDGHVLPLDF